MQRLWPNSYLVQICPQVQLVHRAAQAAQRLRKRLLLCRHRVLEATFCRCKLLLHALGGGGEAKWTALRGDAVARRIVGARARCARAVFHTCNNMQKTSRCMQICALPGRLGDLQALVPLCYKLSSVKNMLARCHLTRPLQRTRAVPPRVPLQSRASWQAARRAARAARPPPRCCLASPPAPPAATSRRSPLRGAALVAAWMRPSQVVRSSCACLRLQQPRHQVDHTM